MEYDTAGKNDIFKFVIKWMDLENIILNEITQTLKDNICTHSQVVFRYKAKKNHSTVLNPRNVNIREDLRETCMNLIYMGYRKRARFP